jgi:hypothetical protein
MAVLSISDLFTPLTAEQIRAQMVTELVSTFEIPADQWRQGGVASTMLTVASIILAMMSTLISDIVKGFFLPTSTGVALKLLALYGYGVTVPEASFATGDVTLTNTEGGSFTRQIGEYVAKNPVTKVTYSNTAAFTLPPNDTVTVAMRADTAGSAGSSTPDTITEHVTNLLGVTVTNPTSLIGVDAPSDPAIRELCLNKLGASSVRGVRTAYAYAIQVAINPDTLGPVNVNRWAISESSSTGEVDLYVAAPSGTPDPSDITGIVTSVEAEARPAGVTADVIGVVEVPYTAALTAYVKAPAGVTGASVKTAIEEEIDDMIAVFPIGGVTASDDTNPTLTGLFGEAITAAAGIACRSVNAQLVSIKGASDQALDPDEVVTNGTSVSIVMLANSSGVLA